MVQPFESHSSVSAREEQERVRNTEPATLGGRTHATMTRVGNNIDLINLYARQKDWYKIFEVVGAALAYGLQRIGSSITGSAKGIEDDLLAVKEQIAALPNISVLKDTQAQVNALIQKNGLEDFKNSLLEKQKTLVGTSKLHGQMVADGLNTGLQMGISQFSSWWEKNQLLRVYGESLKQEFGIQKATYDDLKRSQNPIIRNATDYYEKKSLWRSVPDFLGLVKIVPFLAEKIAPASKFGKAMRAAQELEFTGIDLSLGAKTLFFLWYFIERQTGGHYELMKIWNKTEGVKNQANLSVNQNVHPGEMVTQEEITGLYREVARERKLRDFSAYDPLTGRIFEQVARYINHNYMPDLYEVKKTTINHRELDNTHFTHADLVALFGTQGININDAYATALRLEVLARCGIEDYRLVDQKIGQLARPERENFASNAAFRTALDHYVQGLDVIATDTLGTAWPAPYIERQIRPGIYKSYGLAPDDDRRLTQIISEDQAPSVNKDGMLKDGTLSSADDQRVAPTMALGDANADGAQSYGETRINRGSESSVQAAESFADNERRVAPTMALGSAAGEGGFADKLGERAGRAPVSTESHLERAEASKETDKALGL